MSVAQHLGIGDPGSGLMACAQGRWGAWAQQHPALKPVGGVAGLRPWLRQAPAAQANAALLALARLGSRRGGDDVAAAAVLAWSLLPGACRVAARLCAVAPAVDELVAAQLWIEIRCLNVQAVRRVAATVLRNVAREVVRDVRAPWALVDIAALDRASRCEAVDQEPLALLGEVLTGAVDEALVSVADCQLLLCLAVEADRRGAAGARGSSGLMAGPVLAQVSQECGVSVSTVQRRARKALATLALAGERW